MRFRTIQPLSPVDWLLMPGGLCAGATLIMALPIKVFGLQLPEPVFAMIPAFAWALIRPSVLPPFLLTGLGLFQDVLWGGPLGLWPLCLLTLYGLAFNVRKVLTSEGFLALWAWFATACSLSFGVGLLLTTMVSGEVANLGGVALQLAVTIALFPLSWRLMERFEDADVRFR